MKPRIPFRGQMPKHLNGVLFFTAAEVLDALGISRTTLWRWHKRGDIPPGAKFRDGTLLFTEEDLDAIRTYATRIEPNPPTATPQLGLFDSESTQRRRRPA